MSQGATFGMYCPTMDAATVASKPTTMAQKYQYSHPMEKPAQLPKAIRP